MGDVKRYQMQESAYGPLVQYKDFFKLENDYSTLLARHNALVEAVAWERECERVERKAKGASRPSYGELAWASDNLTKARAEVDRLLEEK